MCHFRRQENCLRISALEQRSDVNDAEFSDLLVFREILIDSVDNGLPVIVDEGLVLYEDIACKKVISDVSLNGCDPRICFLNLVCNPLGRYILAVKKNEHRVFSALNIDHGADDLAEVACEEITVFVEGSFRCFRIVKITVEDVRSLDRELAYSVLIRIDYFRVSG